MAATDEIAPFPGPAPMDIDRPAERHSLATRANHFARLWAMKLGARGFVLARRHVWSHPPAERPTYYKSYPSRPNLEAHVFIPQTYKAGDPGLPLLIDIHGGGFAIGAPVVDNTDNATWAHTHGFVVVSLAYRLAPLDPFPAAVHDVADQMKDVFDDKDLPVDWSRVVVTGYSAGGNLALTAPQLHGLASRLSAVVAWYPAVDMVTTPDERDKWAVPHPDGRPDMLLVSSRYFQWGYVEPGTPLRDPLLSPRFAARDMSWPSMSICSGRSMICYAMRHGQWRRSWRLRRRAKRKSRTAVARMRAGSVAMCGGNVSWA